MMIPMALFWGLVLWGVFALVQRSSRPGESSSASGESALELLKKRYARGEVSREEYEQKRRDIE